MASYRKKEARDWAKEHLRGVANVVIPSFSNDLKRLNEKGIRHDIRRELELGFAGTLLVSEVAMSIDEYGRFFEIANDESKGRLKLIHHASFDTFEDNIEAVRHAERNGAELVLLSYPPNFWPKSMQEIYDYTKAYCDATDLGVLLFPMNLWGFNRLHPSDIEVSVIRRLIDNSPNVVAIKAEGGFPGIMGFVECYRLFGREVIVTCPIVHEMVALAQLAPMQFTGTSNTEYYGAMVPRMFDHLQKQEYDAATKLYWQLYPAFNANGAGAAPNAHFIHRMFWKFQGWLNGFNGGPLRQPTMRIHEPQMNTLRQGMIKSGLTPTELPNEDFFIGRNPD
ncbi:MAG TPA: dihydrodipicolinate synthase family protein [Stellaceae bacterium]|jgi:4-hydroxy-tetrahydrodipicolinate synthase|nr:dihydrodipicolinate synthase family protein [Stellaceae bacterium]